MTNGLSCFLEIPRWTTSQPAYNSNTTATVLSLGSLEPVPEPLERTAQGPGSGQPLALLPRISEKLHGLLVQIFLPISQTALELGFMKGLFTPKHGEQLSRGEARHMVK